MHPRSRLSCAAIWSRSSCWASSTLAALDQARAWIDGALADRRADRRFPFAVLAAEDGSVIGSTSYWDFDAHNAHVEIGSTWLNCVSWGTGRNAEAKLLLMTHAFETLGLERVVELDAHRVGPARTPTKPSPCG
jgi:RimJ/RimL family protein N-acetyltransferase